MSNTIAASRHEEPRATIRTWRDRIGAGADFPLHAPTDVERAMVAEISELRARVEVLEGALSYYADGHHLTLADPDAWDTVSGEPINFLCDDAGTATVEDGSVAKCALDGVPLADDEMRPVSSMVNQEAK